MYDRELAIVDIETTGLTARFNRIIEIAVIKVRSGEVAETYSTLIDPEMRISPYIETLTGITNDDLLGAPTFGAMQKDLFDLLDGALFVAHNARFDYGFLREEFRRGGMEFNARCLCTMRLSRRLFPGERKHSLDSIMNRFGLTCADRHRALGDATVVWDFMKLLEGRFSEEELARAFTKISRTPTLPPLLEEGAVKNLPESAGVYIFYDEAGSPLYVGKSGNIRGRVLSHFSNGHGLVKEATLCRQTAGIRAIETAGDLGALLLESRLIKELLPLYNRRARTKRGLVLAREEEDKEGFRTIRLEQSDLVRPPDLEGVISVFTSLRQAKEYLWDAASTYRLCPRKLGIEKGKGDCSYRQLGKCAGACTGSEPPLAYNLRFALAMKGRGIRPWPFPGPILIEEAANDPHRGDAFLVDRWCLLGSFEFDGYCQRRRSTGGLTFDHDTYKILLHYLQRPGTRARIREISPDEIERLQD